MKTTDSSSIRNTLKELVRIIGISFRIGIIILIGMKQSRLV